MKIVINRCFGGFGLSPEAALLCFERGMTQLGTPVDEYFREVPSRGGGVNEKQKAERLAAWVERQKKIELHRAHMKTFPESKVPLSHDGSLFLIIFNADHTVVVDSGVDDEDRGHPILVQVVEELGAAANGNFADLAVVEIPDGVDWVIEEYDGREWVAEKHRAWH